MLAVLDVRDADAGNAGTADHAGKLLYTVEQTLLVLGMSRSQLYREMARGAIRGIRIGHARRFSRAELVRYVEACYATQDAEAAPAERPA